MDRLAGAYYLLCTAKDNVDLAFQQGEGLLEIVTVRRRPSAGRNIHVDQAKPARCVFAR
jgi:hypothetical protein